MKTIDKVLLACTFTLMLLYVFASIGYPQEVVYYDTNQKQINWDQEFKQIPTDQAKWNVYVVNLDKGQTKENPTFYISATARPITLQLNEEGRFLIGVSALRVVNDNVTIESKILWSDETLQPFGFRNYSGLPMPNNLRAVE